MKIHVTHTGRILLIVVAIGIVIFFLAGGFAAMLKLIENKRVADIPSPALTEFTSSSLPYNDMSGLKSAFQDLYKIYGDRFGRLEKLKNKYPHNEDIPVKIDMYKKYLDSMKTASFQCPEHIDSGTENRLKKCGSCNGKGRIRRWYFAGISTKCDTCVGEIYYSVKVGQACPNCGQINRGTIKGETLLKKD